VSWVATAVSVVTASGGATVSWVLTASRVATAFWVVTASRAARASSAARAFTAATAAACSAISSCASRTSFLAFRFAAARASGVIVVASRCRWTSTSHCGVGHSSWSAASAWARSSVTARRAYHFLSAGMTYHGARGVEVRASMSAYAAW